MMRPEDEGIMRRRKGDEEAQGQATVPAITHTTA